jgi:hypothetical protein
MAEGITTMLRTLLMVMLSVLVAACQTVSVVDHNNVAISVENGFALGTDATFRPFAVLRPPANKSSACYKFAPSSYPQNLSGFEQAEGGTSLTRNHGQFSDIWSSLHQDAVIALTNGGEKFAQPLIDAMVRFAEAGVLLETIDPYTAYRQKCWSSAGASCPMHHAQTAAEFFINATHAAVLVRAWLNAQPAKKKKIDAWLDQGFDYVEGLANLQGKGPNGGLYEYMNGKAGVLVYAIYRNDPELFLDYAGSGLAQIAQHMNDDGYIYSNSWRGSRALWYHSLGLGAVFAFGELLEAQGIRFFDHPILKDRLRKSYAAALKGAHDWKWFESKGTRGYNFITDGARARRYLHRSASSLQWIGAWRYPDIGQMSLPESFDSVSGILPACLYADRKEILKKREWAPGS